MLGVSLGLKANIFGTGLETHMLGLATQGHGLTVPGLGTSLTSTDE